jgi:hypothetical protein
VCVLHTYVVLYVTYIQNICILYIHAQDWTQMVEKEREAFAEFFDGKNVKKVLDASCGSGEQAIAFATPYYVLYYTPYYYVIYTR